MDDVDERLLAVELPEANAGDPLADELVTQHAVFIVASWDALDRTALAEALPRYLALQPLHNPYSNAPVRGPLRFYYSVCVSLTESRWNPGVPCARLKPQGAGLPISPCRNLQRQVVDWLSTSAMRSMALKAGATPAGTTQ